METLHELIKARRAKLQAFRDAGIEPYPYNFKRTHLAQQIFDSFENLQNNKTDITVAGRLVAKRVMGKAAFAHIQDESGRIQIYVKRDDINTEENSELYSLFKTKMDLGDWVGIRGTAFVTQTGEKSLHVYGIALLAKCLRPLPVVKEEADTGERHHEFTDTDERYRNRPLDLVVNHEESEVFRIRAKLIAAMRRILEEHGFLEVETPVLQPLYGGGTARPFITHHHQLKKDLYLRIADELYLKRLIVGGLNRVYEISKDFRNEGVDRTHNPEFTMMECYAAFEDYNFMMAIVEETVSTIAKELHGSYEVKFGDKVLDFTPPWDRIKFFDALNKMCGDDLSDADLSSLKEVAKRHHIEISAKSMKGKALDTLFGELVEPSFTR
ncbi:lysine--tRNA ligase, partial [Calditrichota bacterium]